MLCGRNISLTIRNMVRATLPKKYLLRRDVAKQLDGGEPELKILPYLCCRSEISIDVGANNGLYSYLFAQYSDHVIAIEPHPRLARRLKSLLPSSVEVLNFAASNEDGMAKFHIPFFEGREIASRCSLDPDANGGMETRTISVAKRRLDQVPIADRSVGTLKIDVEGHELSALQGAVAVLEEFNPSIIVESESRHHAEAPENVFQFLFAFGYHGYFIHRDKLRNIAEFSVDRFQSIGESKPICGRLMSDYVNNFIFIHPSRSQVLEGIKQMFPLESQFKA